MELCEDFAMHVSCVDADGQVVHILAVADGMGSCPRAQDGARGVCQNFADHLRMFLLSHVHEEVSQQVCRKATLAFFHELEQPRDYGTTFLVALVAEHTTHLFQCGDGDIFFSSEDQPSQFATFVMNEAQGGAYSNSTYPADIAIEKGKDSFISIVTPQRLALMSDGVSPFFVDGRGIVHPDAADRLFSHFEALEFADGEANQKLSNTLNQEHFKSVHDDRSAVLLYR